MSDLEILGIPLSSYTWSVRLVCAEKGVAFEMVEQFPQSRQQKALHPFGKVPVLRHGDFHLYETSAILRYLDDTYPEPPLQPETPRERAVMEQWISAINDVYYDAMMRRLALQRLAPSIADRPSDEAVIENALPDVAFQLDLLDKVFADTDFLAGDRVSLADILLLPIIATLAVTPEGDDFLNNRPHLRRWQKAMAARPSFVATMPSFLDDLPL
ncbi:MAG: glutathione S-transferase family protein [Alphaproteobacteria bacterium]|jgi:glutathione S-transferase|nr:hypothetical protein [Rhodospirillaceae bacterium]MDP6403977.1 glutathione S-transferase family protein [Alphaproteobacteria bacterium]MDP6620804.1 glutathione S-transferase family protein [Alphaproteobacteria bacterium]|tara:strand:- start:1414 stop:2055 length:642 start_codon:yes stop_codon:yes gene_type:complete